MVGPGRRSGWSRSRPGPPGCATIEKGEIDAMPDRPAPWSEEYGVHGIPETLQPYPKVPTHTFLNDAAVKYPRMGYVQMGYAMTYPEAKDKVDRLAAALRHLGSGRGTGSSPCSPHPSSSSWPITPSPRPARSMSPAVFWNRRTSWNTSSRTRPRRPFLSSPTTWTSSRGSRRMPARRT